jgi:DNA-binding response OmpR family regulator
VLLDLNLPRRNGFEVLRRLRASASLSQTPVVVVTSSNAPSDQKQAADLGASYFRKPLSYSEFMKLGGVLRDLMGDNPSED